MIKKKITTVLTALIMLLNIFVSARSYTDTAGRNVNEKVKATFNEFKAYDYDVPTYSVIKPNDGGSFYFDISFTFDSDIKEGDFFTVKYDDKLNITGTLENVYPLSLVTDTGEVIAIGGFDKESNSSVFTFTDYISKHENVTAAMSANAFVEITKVKHTSKNVKFEIDAAGEKKSLTIDVDYSNYYNSEKNASVGSLIISNNDITEKVTYISYINPKGDSPKLANVFIYPDSSGNYSTYSHIATYKSDRELNYINSSNLSKKSGVVLNSSDTNLKIYKVPAGENLPESYGLTDEDYNKFEDVTSQFSLKYTHNEEADIDFIQLNFDSKMSQNEKYVIKIVTKAVNDKEIRLTTDVVTDYYYYYAFASSSAEILAFDGWSTGNGTDTTYLEINKVDKETKAVLKGSTFRLYSTEKNEKGELVYNEINSDPIGSEKNGLFFNKLKTGIYYLEEIKAPNGYKKPKDENNKKTVEVKKEDGKLKVYVDSKVLENNKLTVENEKLPEQIVTKEVTFSKTEINGTKELEGANLKVEKLKEDGSVEKEIASWKSETIAKK